VTHRGPSQPSPESQNGGSSKTLPVKRPGWASSRRWFLCAWLRASLLPIRGAWPGCSPGLFYLVDVPKRLLVSLRARGRRWKPRSLRCAVTPPSTPVSQQTTPSPNPVSCLRSSKGRNRGSGTSRTWRRARSSPMPPQVRWPLGTAEP